MINEVPPKKPCECTVDMQQTRYCREDGDNSQENRTRQGDLRNNTVNKISGGFARFNSWYKAAVLFHIISHLVRVYSNGRIKISKYDNEYCK